MEWLSESLGVTIAASVAASALAAYHIFGKTPPAVKGLIDVDNQSYEIEPGVRASHLCKDGKLISHLFEDAKTCHEAFKRGLRLSNNGPFLGTRRGPSNEYVWVSYQEAYDAAQKIGSALVHLGVPASEEGFVGIYASNREEWVMVAEGCNMFSMVVVPLYDTLGVEACTYIINQTQMTMVICDKPEKAQSLLSAIEDTPSIKCIVVMDSGANNNDELASKHGVKLLSYTEMLEIGQNNLHDPVPPEPDNVATVCYTSGTTGNPKGVLLTHKNIISNLAAFQMQTPMTVNPSDIHFSYLPLAHMFERIVQALVIQSGARVGFFGGDVRKLLDDMQFLKPTIFPTVPRLLNRIYDRVMAGVQGSVIKSWLFNLALNRKMALLKQGIETKETIWDTLVFSKVQKMMGGNVKFAVTGSAPLASNVLAFARCAFGCSVFEGYGQTEATAGITFSLVGEHRPGHVGAPMACNFVKLIDVPEMNYYAKDGKGEVCAKGCNIMKGYYKDEKKTAEALDADGWLATGDIGQWMPNGALKIIDRRKHIFKLAQGEYLAPEKIEGVYVRCPLIAQAFVDGNSLQAFIVGVMVPDPDVMPAWAQKQGISGSMQDLCNNQTVKKLILADLNKVGKEGGLKGFEQVRAIHLCPDMFSVENGLLTPTFKSKRPTLRTFFADHIEAMYNTN